MRIQATRGVKLEQCSICKLKQITKEKQEKHIGTGPNYSKCLTSEWYGCTFILHFRQGFHTVRGFKELHYGGVVRVHLSD
uniref:Uncharacterized protein n=1 Tax=Anguilla anguilla TaxID=7936 RepID=A0A0E9X4Y9_ANGAN